MSHFQAYDCKVTNLEFVKRALVEMGYGYKENTTIIDYFKQNRKVALAVVDSKGKLMPVGFAVNKNPDGSTELECQADWYMTPFSEKQFTNRVAQLHDKYTVLEMCEENRWAVDEDSFTTNDAGVLEFVATQWA